MQLIVSFAVTAFYLFIFLFTLLAVLDAFFFASKERLNGVILFPFSCLFQNLGMCQIPMFIIIIVTMTVVMALSKYTTKRTG